MKEDDTLRQLFEDYRPDMGDATQYMSELERRLEGVELVRQYQERRQHHYRMAVVMALVLGMVCGAVAMAVVLSMPNDAPLLSLGWHWPWLAVVEQNSRLVSLTILSAFMGSSLIGVLHLRQELCLHSAVLRHPKK